MDSLANAAAFAVLALGLNIVVGFAGLLDLGYAAFFAIGAYTYGMASSFQIMPPWTPCLGAGRLAGLAEKLDQGAGDVVHFTVSFWLMLPVSALLAAGFGVLFGAPTLRLRGDYLAIVTLGFGEIVPIVARNVPAADQRRDGTERRRGAQPVRLRASASTPRPTTTSRSALVALLIFVSIRLRDSAASAAPGWRSARTRSRPAAMGVNLVRVQAAGVRHRRRLRRG